MEPAPPRLTHGRATPYSVHCPIAIADAGYDPDYGVEFAAGRNISYDRHGGAQRPRHPAWRRQDD
jgi:hypothetical protein